MEGNPIALLDWAARFSDLEGRTLAKDEFEHDGQPIKVMTIWIGMDEDYFGGKDETPRIFGTAVWKKGQLTEEFRSTTKEDAIATHAVVVQISQGVSAIRLPGT